MFRVHLRVKPSIKRTQSISENLLSLVPAVPFQPSGNKRDRKGYYPSLLLSLLEDETRPTY